MTKKHLLPHWGSKGAVNRAGDAVRAGYLSDSQTVILESWRMSHRRVIHTFEALLRARAKDLPVEVAQRLKRRNTIVDKLFRFPRMQLARMDDVAGCRLIFKSIHDLYAFRAGVHAAHFNHVLKNGDNKDKYDYIKSPTSRGYRGIHDIYEYRARKGASQECNGLLIEIQYRTVLQHSWATAVEVVTQTTEQFDLELEAAKKLAELEKEFPNDNIVLVGARSVEEVLSAFRNYFNDVRDFLTLMATAHMKLSGRELEMKKAATEPA